MRGYVCPYTSAVAVEEEMCVHLSEKERTHKKLTDPALSCILCFMVLFLKHAVQTSFSSHSSNVLWTKFIDRKL